MPSLRFTVRALAVGVLVGFAASASAVPCGASRDWISVEIAVPADYGLDKQEVLAQLRPGLHLHDLDVCAGGLAKNPPKRRITIAESTPAPAVRIEVSGPDGKFQSSQNVELGDVPKAGRSLVVALTAEELLSAEPAEVDEAPAPVAPPPRLEAEVEVPPVAPPADKPAVVVRPRRFMAGAQLGASWYSGKLTLLDGELLFGVLVLRRLALVLRGGYGAGPKRSVEAGTLSSRFGAVALQVRYTVTPSRLLGGLDAMAAVDALFLDVKASPSPGHLGVSFDDVAVVAEVGGVGWLSLPHDVRLQLSVAVAIPARKVVAFYGPTSVAGISGIGVASSLGAVYLF